MSRVTYSQSDSPFECRIATWKYWAWIIMWPPASVFWVAAVADMLAPHRGKSPMSPIALSILLTVWIGSGCLLTLNWVITVFGAQTISISDRKLTLGRWIMPRLGRIRSISVEEIRDVATQGPFGPPNMWRFMLKGMTAREDMAKFYSRGTVTFKRRGKPYRLGAQLTQEEAGELARWLLSHLPPSARPHDDEESW